MGNYLDLSTSSCCSERLKGTESDKFETPIFKWNFLSNARDIANISSVLE